ncbi:hypothetical protein [Brevibacterium moorei]|uniref:hypothetical protein n=1 Tax=Brevibacterium moorei TaxID=2968457 RepID=UPI00211C7F4A|nr:hypothetical protein [Brevibacterium sp. 68QC2CO]MCQ9384379.1 hypothetical protein [Brevibacterium sp. 68QC2CO]
MNPAKTYRARRAFGLWAPMVLAGAAATWYLAVHAGPSNIVVLPAVTVLAVGAVMCWKEATGRGSDR